MDNIERLVTVMYTPGAGAAAIQQAQRELQAVQKSPDGWALAGLLLGAADPNAQFLGAQTFVVKLNQGSGVPAPAEQRRELLGWLEHSVQHQYSPFVVRKVLAVLTKLFLAADWPDGAAQVLAVVGAASPYAADFLTMLVEDSELASADLRAKLVPHMSSAVQELVSGERLADARALRLFEVWATAFFDQFKALLPNLLALIEHTYGVEGAEELCVAAIQTASGLYSYDHRSWPGPAVKQLETTMLSLTGRYGDAVPPPDFADDDKFIALAQLVVTFSMEDFEKTALHAFLAQLAGAAVPVVDDPLATEVLGFWNQYAEEVVASGLSSASTPLVAGVISSYWPRVRLYDDLRASDWEEFAGFRKDFADFLELAYPLLGTPLFEHLTRVVLDALPVRDWLTVELGLYCLNGLADIIGDDYRGERPELRSVQQIFQSSLWAELPQCTNYRVKQTAVHAIGCFVDFFVAPEGRAHLAATLTYLFACLGERELQNSASRSIQKLCDTSRAQLVGELPAFLAVYGGIRGALAEVPHVRTASGIAFVLQAQPDMAVQAHCLLQLLELVLSAENAEMSADERWRAQLRCVAAIAKSVKAVDTPNNAGDASSGRDANSASDASAVEFWERDETAAAIHAIVERLAAAALDSADLDAVEAVCDTIKAGMTERAGPFRLGEDRVVGFVAAKLARGPPGVLAPVLDLARFYVMTLTAQCKARTLGGGSAAALRELLAMLAHGVPPVALSAALDVLTQAVGLAAALSATAGTPTQLLDFAPPEVLAHGVAGVASSDRFVAKSTTTFWKEFLAHNALPGDAAGGLVRAVLAQVAGGAARSELGYAVDILKALLARQPLVALPLLRELVVAAPELPAVARLDAKTRSDFVAQLTLLKGGRRTFDAAQKFWLRCRNIPESYDPGVALE